MIVLVAGGAYLGWTRYGPHATASPATPTDSTQAADSALMTISGPPDGADTVTVPLIDEATVSWAEANSFDRYTAKQQLEEGERYLFGRGVPQDFDHARQALEAAGQYEGRAAYLLYEMYAYGQGVAPDMAQSLGWLQRSAALGDAEGQYTLGRFYIEGVRPALQPDLVMADRLLAAAAAQGHPGAASLLGNLRRGR